MNRLSRGITVAVVVLAIAFAMTAATSSDRAEAAAATHAGQLCPNTPLGQAAFLWSNTLQTNGYIAWAVTLNMDELHSGPYCASPYSAWPQVVVSYALRVDRFVYPGQWQTCWYEIRSVPGLIQVTKNSKGMSGACGAVPWPDGFTRSAISITFNVSGNQYTVTDTVVV